MKGRFRGYLSRNLFVPWVINGPWTTGKRRYRAALAEARHGFRIWENSDADSRTDWVLNELRTVVRWAGEKVPYYRSLFRKIGFDPKVDFTFADYRQLPVLERSTVREQATELLADGFSTREMRLESTGGSTGMPVRFWLDVRSSAWRYVAAEWAFAKFGYRQGDRVGKVWGFAADPQARASMRARLSGWLVHSQMNDCYRLSDEILDRIHARMVAYKPQFLQCYTSALALLARRLERLGIKPDYPAQAIFTGAEKLDGSHRHFIQSVFTVPIYESYGSRDCGLIAMQIDSNDHRLHIAGANILVEPYGMCDPNSGSEIVLTDLHRLGMPFLRYRIGDRARFVFDSDQPAELLEEISGRTADHVLLPNGKIVHGVQFPRLFRDFDICEYQVIQDVRGDVQVSLIPGLALKSDDLIRIERVLRDNLVGITVRISLIPSIERTAAGKLRPVISHYSPTT